MPELDQLLMVVVLVVIAHAATPALVAKAVFRANRRAASIVVYCSASASSGVCAWVQGENLLVSWDSIGAMNTTVTVRQATVQDLPTLALLFDGYRRFYERESDAAGAHAFLRDRFLHAESVIFLAFDGETPVGFTQLYPSFSSVSMARIFILNDLFVREHARRKGAAGALIEAAAAFAKTVGAVRLTLSTAETNVVAQALYESLGWRRDEQFRVYHLAL